MSNKNSKFKNLRPRRIRLWRKSAKLRCSAPLLLFFVLSFSLFAFRFSLAQEIPLEVRIGGAVSGVGEFVVQDLGQYLSILYNYLIGIAGVLATVMIMVGGVRWLLAAGDPGKIGAAKETIGSAVIGLALALGSFLVLNTINPQLVELRLPYIPKVVRDEYIFGNRCSRLPAETRFALAGETPAPGKRSSYSPPPSAFPLEKPATECTKSFYYTPGGSSVCVGDVCPVGKACIWNDDKFECKPAVIAGTISFKEKRYLDNDIDLRILCNNGKNFAAEFEDADAPVVSADGSGTQYYAIAFDQREFDRMLDDCDSNGGVKGFYLESDEFNDEGEALGAIASSVAGLAEGCAVGVAAIVAVGGVGGAVTAPLGCVAGVVAATIDTDDHYAMLRNICGAGINTPPIFTDNPAVPDTANPEHWIVDPDKLDWRTVVATTPSDAIFTEEMIRTALNPASPKTILCDIETSFERFPRQ